VKGGGGGGRLKGNEERNGDLGVRVRGGVRDGADWKEGGGLV
jgi:hypothetical protein